MNYSVIVCSFNKLEYLKRVVAGLQKIGGDHEYILSDDLSTDGTLEWAEESKFFGKILVMKEPGNYRLNSIRNRGIQEASNKYAVFLDADCVPEDNYFEGHDSVFECDPRRLSVGFTHFFDSEGKRLLAPDHRFAWLKPDSNECNIGWMAAYGGNIAIPKNIWAEAGQFDESFNGAWGLEDAEFAYRTHLIGARIVAHRKSVVRHLNHPHTGTKEMRQGRGPNTRKFKDKHGFFPC